MCLNLDIDIIFLSLDRHPMSSILDLGPIFLSLDLDLIFLSGTIDLMQSGFNLTSCSYEHRIVHKQIRQMDGNLERHIEMSKKKFETCPKRV